VLQVLPSLVNNRLSLEGAVTRTDYRFGGDSMRAATYSALSGAASAPHRVAVVTDRPRRSASTGAGRSAASALRAAPRAGRTLDWWYTKDEAFDGECPVDLLTRGELTRELIDLVVTLSR
jgi:hypothetical protein